LTPFTSVKVHSGITITALSWSAIDEILVLSVTSTVEGEKSWLSDETQDANLCFQGNFDDKSMSCFPNIPAKN
jgi:hypothetical protein